ncbi:hypothetical protein BESB_010820 [Besnoitia besnoiti]|uniref:RING-type domain-containing protein n=1 Tax=Besnoitia besnoiti TaxID=94643 RepID=A0A2A9MR13_BESBE|nr:hypothetical protein BESB_010820 [Besnoitia besnoiti]PFH38740.1 hypothetical protein BESB_010820 [Besnoitia besnoiti]
MQQLRRLNFFDGLLVQRPPSSSLQSQPGGAPGFPSPSASAASQPPHLHGAAASPQTPDPFAVLPPGAVACVAGTEAQVWIGDERGRAFVFTDERFLYPIELSVFSLGFLSIHAAREANCVVCLGRDRHDAAAQAASPAAPQAAVQRAPGAEEGGVWKYKCFSCIQVDARGQPVLIREATLFTRMPEQILSCSDVNGAFSMLAGGTIAAGVCLFRGDLLREKTCRLRLIKESDLPVTAVRFLTPQHANVAEDDTERRSHLFVATAQGIYVYAVPAKGDPQMTYRDDMRGLPSPLLAARLTPNQVAIQQGEGIFCLDAYQGNLWALPTDGECIRLASHKNYLIAVSVPRPDESHAECSSVYGWDGVVFFLAQDCFLTVYRANPETRFIAFSCPLQEVTHIVSALGSLYIICRDANSGRNLLFELREKGFCDRLNILLRKRLFDWAADIVLQEGQPKSTLQEVYRVHADWLYEKRIFDKALRIYIKTIGALEPSYVIEKYLHCQRLWPLALYLLHLHRARLAAQEHTLLFFKCAAKLKDVNLFAAFLEDPTIRSDAILPAAVKECRANGYLKLASLIASRHGFHDDHVSILLTDYGNFDEAVAYLKHLDAPSACSLLLTHGYALLSRKPRETLDLLKNIIFNYQTSVDIFIPLFLDREPLLLYFLLSLLYGETYARAFLRTQRELAEDASCLRGATPAGAFSASPAEDFLSLSRIFDEPLAQKRDDQRADETLAPQLFGSASFATLLEILLRFYKRAREASRGSPRADSAADAAETQKREASVANGITPRGEGAAQRDRRERGAIQASQYAGAVMKVLKERSMADDELFTSTLLTCVYDFEEGLGCACEKQENFQLALSRVAEDEDVAALLIFCLANTSKDPTLWIQTLALLASRDNTETQIQQLLAHIETNRLLPPLAVLDVLEHGSRVRLGAVKGYLIHCLDKLSREFEISARHFQQDEAEVASMQAEIHRLRMTGKVFDSASCVACGGALDLSAVHFACSHAFHLVCLTSRDSDHAAPTNRDIAALARNAGMVSSHPDAGYSCPICTPQAEAKRLLLAQREADSRHADDFFKFLRGSADGFSFIASYFGKAMFPTLPANLTDPHHAPGSFQPPHSVSSSFSAARASLSSAKASRPGPFSPGMAPYEAMPGDRPLVARPAEAPRLIPSPPQAMQSETLAWVEESNEATTLSRRRTGPCGPVAQFGREGCGEETAPMRGDSVAARALQGKEDDAKREVVNIRGTDEGDVGRGDTVRR